MTDTIEQQVLHALFCLSRDTRHIDATTLAAALGLTPTRAASALLALERQGLVDASRARLTMLGLARAVQLGPAAGGPRLDLGAAVAAATRRPSEAPLPVAARPAHEPEPGYPDAAPPRSAGAVPLAGGHGAVLSPLS